MQALTKQPELEVIMAAAILRTGAIYAIRNIVNGKVYIGRSADVERRKRRHFAMLKAGKHHSQILQNAYNKHGLDAFVAETLLVCRFDHLSFYEQLLIDGFDSYENGYNACPVSGAPMAGRITSEATKAKQSASLKGVAKSEESIRKSALARTGIKHSQTSIENNRRAKLKPESRAATSARMIGNSNALGSVRSAESILKYQLMWTPERKAALAERMRLNNPRKRKDSDGIQSQIAVTAG